MSCGRRGTSSRWFRSSRNSSSRSSGRGGMGMAAVSGSGNVPRRRWRTVRRGGAWRKGCGTRRHLRRVRKSDSPYGDTPMRERKGEVDSILRRGAGALTMGVKFLLDSLRLCDWLELKEIYLNRTYRRSHGFTYLQAALPGTGGPFSCRGAP